MTSPEYAALGFQFDEFDELMEAIMDATGGQAMPASGYEGAVVYQDPAGPRLCALQNAEGGWTVVPGYLSNHTMFAQVYRAGEHLAGVELLKDEKVFNQVVCASDESFALPAAFPGGGQRLRANELELSAAALGFSLYDTLEEWQSAEGSLGSSGQEPGMLYSAATEEYYRSLSPRALNPYALVAGTIVGAQLRQNALTGQNFYAMGLELPGGIFTILAPADAASTSGAQPQAGQIFDGKVFMMASAGYWRTGLQLRG